MVGVGRKHILLFAFPAQGHLAGLVAIARLLRRELPHATVTLVSTPRNVDDLRSSLAAAEPSIGFHALPFVPADHGLPAGCDRESTTSFALLINLFEAFEALEPAFDDYVSALLGAGTPADDVCIVADVFVAWTVGVALRRGCKHAVYVSCSAFGSAIFHALWQHMPALPLGSDGMLRLPELPGLVFHRSQLSPAFLFAGQSRDRWTAYFQRLISHVHRTDAVLGNTVEELEPTGLAMARRILRQVPVWPIGPLVGGEDPKTAPHRRRTTASCAGWTRDRRRPSCTYRSGHGARSGQTR